MKQPRQSDLRKTRTRSLHPHARAGASLGASAAANPGANLAARLAPVPAIHPDTETLSAFAEHELAQPEHDQTLAHLATCSRCRQIVFLAQQAAEAESPAASPVPLLTPSSTAARAESPIPTPLATPFDSPEDAPRKNLLATLFPNLSFPALAAVACCVLAAGTLLLFPHLHSKTPTTTPLVATQTEQQSAKLAQPEPAQPSLSQPEPQSATKIRSRTKSRPEPRPASRPEASPEARPAQESQPHSSRPGRPHSPSSESKSLAPESFQAALKPQSPQPSRVSPPRQSSALASPLFPGTAMGFTARATTPRFAAPAPVANNPAAQLESRSTLQPNFQPSSQPVDVTALTQALMDPAPLPAAAVIHAEEAEQQHVAKSSASSRALASAAHGAVAPRTPAQIQAQAQLVQSELAQLSQAQVPQIASIPPLADGAITTQQITELPKKQRATPTPGNAAQASPNLAAENLAVNQTANQAANQAADKSLAAGALSRTLPNGQNPIAAAAIGSTLLAIDSTGYLERSDDAGKSWEPIAPQWPGRLVSVRISPGTTSNPQPSQFEIVTDQHLVYRSADGQTWTSLPNPTEKQK